MSEKEVSDQLEANCRSRYESAKLLKMQQRESEAHLSDDEWWEAMVADAERQNPGTVERMKALRESVIAERHRESLTPDLIDMMVQADVARVLPHLLAHRDAEMITGPVTPDQFHAAFMIANQHHIESMAAQLRQSVDREQNPSRKAFLDQFASNVEVDLDELGRLLDPNVSEKTLSEVAMGISDRMNKLTESLKKSND